MRSGFPVISQQTGDMPLRTAFVFGERNSGTNLASELLRRNFPTFKDMAGDRIAQFGFPYGWKHGFPTMVSAPHTTLAVAVFRDPEIWVQSMHKRPWHAVPTLAARGFSEFLRSRWVSRVDEQNFGVMKGSDRWLSELQYDRHPLTGAPFDNLAQLRRAKNAGFLGLANRFSNCLFVRHEDLVSGAEQFVAHVAEEFKVSRGGPFVPVENRRGRPAEGPYQSVNYAPLSEADRSFLWSQLDHAQEQYLGYSPS